MSEIEVTGNFNTINDLVTTVYDVRAVPGDLWRPIQAVQRESLRSHVPQTEWADVDDAISWNNPARYRNTRINPEVLVEEGIWNPQLLRDVTVAVLSEGASDGPVQGAVISQHATSPSLAPKLHLSPRGSLGRLEQWAKMVTPPELHVPVIGGKRNVHIRELFAHPEAQDIDWEHEVSGIVLVGLWHSLALRHPEETVREYVIPADKKDYELTQVGTLLEAENFGKRVHELPGFKQGSELVGMKTVVGAAMDKIVSIPGAQAVLPGTTLRVPAVKPETERQKRKRMAREDWQDYAIRHTMGGK